MLDRGETKDWFASTEIIIEAVDRRPRPLSVPGAHADGRAARSSSPRLFKDRNFAAGLLFIFVVGIILLATLALLPPFLQNLMGYPVLTTGLRAGAARHRHDDRDVRWSAAWSAGSTRALLILDRPRR